MTKRAFYKVGLVRIRARGRCALLDELGYRCARRAVWRNDVFTNPEHHPTDHSNWLIVEVCDDCAKKAWPNEFPA